MLLLRRVSRHSPPDESGDLMLPTSAVRERLLPDQDGPDEYSGGDDAASRFDIPGGGGTAASGETRSSRQRKQGVEVVDRIEDILLRERGQEQPSSHHSSASGAATTTMPEGGMGGDGDKGFLV